MLTPKVPGRTTPGFAFSMIDRTLQECLSPRKFGKEEVNKVIDFFGRNPLECVYCGSKDIKRWDHLIPIKSGGETVLGNMVPSCALCDDSKRDKSYEEWMNCEVKGSPKSMGVKDIPQRIENIKGYINRFGYKTVSEENKLTTDESARLKDIRLNLKEIRREIESLINDYKIRTKG